MISWHPLAVNPIIYVDYLYCLVSNMSLIHILRRFQCVRMSSNFVCLSLDIQVHIQTRRVCTRSNHQSPIFDARSPIFSVYISIFVRWNICIHKSFVLGFIVSFLRNLVFKMHLRSIWRSTDVSFDPAMWICGRILLCDSTWTPVGDQTIELL